MKARLLWLSGAIALLVLASSAPLLLFRQVPPKSRFEKVEVGMTLEEVQSIFGRAADIPAYTITRKEITGRVLDKWPKTGSAKCWSFEEGFAAVAFDSGRVVDKNWQENYGTKPSLFQRFRWWVGF
jgi:hypothetical protein